MKPDPRYNSILASKFINCLMWDGKKSTAEAIVYGAFEIVDDVVDDLVKGCWGQRQAAHGWNHDHAFHLGRRRTKVVRRDIEKNQMPVVAGRRDAGYGLHRG
mgnify:CR=1 FL=1